MQTTTMSEHAADRPQRAPATFTEDDVETLRRAAESIAYSDQTGDRVAAVRAAAALRDIATRIEHSLRSVTQR